jgi:hypothetical protein
MKKYNLTVGWLYPELMSTYGDRGNILVLKKRCEWGEIKIKINKLNIGFTDKDLRKCDLLFMGGAQDKQQQITAFDLMQKKKTLQEMIEDSIPGLYICGAYQFLGKYYKEADGTVIEGLGILDLYTESPEVNFPRLIGNCIAKMPDGNMIVGFENHGGRTYLGKQVKPLGKIIKGFGNNGRDGTEGAVYRNSFGTYLHGPFLPKNPKFADYLIKIALKKKYKVSPTISLSPLNDSLEKKARNAIANRLGVKL